MAILTINPSESEAERIKKTFLENPWSNAYWFARMFINSDKYGSIGKENKLLAEIAIGLRSIAEDMNGTLSIAPEWKKRLCSKMTS